MTAVRSLWRRGEHALVVAACETGADFPCRLHTKFRGDTNKILDGLGSFKVRRQLANALRLTLCARAALLPSPSTNLAGPLATRAGWALV